MSRKATVIALVVTFVLGAALGTAIAKKRVDPSLFVGAEPAAAAAALLDLGAEQAEDGTWERIAIARVHLLSGQVEKARSIFDAITADDPAASDWLRIGGCWAEAGSWPEAKAAFAKALEKKGDDGDYLAEIGAYHNLAGEREAAEEMFRTSFAESPEDPYNTAMMAGSYLGISPRRW